MPKIVWYARGGGIAKMGPFDTQVAAVNAMRLAPLKEGIWTTRAQVRAREAQIFPKDIFVWPEVDNG